MQLGGGGGPGGAAPGAGGTPAAGGGGASQGGGASAGTGGASAYDPTIQFDWPEAKPTAGSCKPGHYSGTYTGNYVTAVYGGGILPVAISGTVDLTLNQSQDGEFFALADGKISGLVYGIIPFSSGLTGTLNCTTLKLVNGFMPNGKYNFLGVDYFFEGPLDADYDKLTNQFVNGKWRVGEPTWKKGDPDPKYGGYGDWTVKWVGP
ncbi:MAG TPA: hypothetical protein VF395_02430 [Polyangiaceae bacterium]